MVFYFVVSSANEIMNVGKSFTEQSAHYVYIQCSLLIRVLSGSDRVKG